MTLKELFIPFKANQEKVYILLCEGKTGFFLLKQKHVLLAQFPSMFVPAPQEATH